MATKRWHLSPGCDPWPWPRPGLSVSVDSPFRSLSSHPDQASALWSGVAVMVAQERLIFGSLVISQSELNCCFWEQAGTINIWIYHHVIIISTYQTNLQAHCIARFLAPIINSSWAPKHGPNMNSEHLRQQLVFYKYSSGNSLTHWSADELLVSPGKICSRYLNILRGQSLERELNVPREMLPNYDYHSFTLPHWTLHTAIIRLDNLILFLVAS